MPIDILKYNSNTLITQFTLCNVYDTNVQSSNSSSSSNCQFYIIKKYDIFLKFYKKNIIIFL